MDNQENTHHKKPSTKQKLSTTRNHRQSVHRTFPVQPKGWAGKKRSHENQTSRHTTLTGLAGRQCAGGKTKRRAGDDLVSAPSRKQILQRGGHIQPGTCATTEASRHTPFCLLHIFCMTGVLNCMTGVLNPPKTSGKCD